MLVVVSLVASTACGREIVPAPSNTVVPAPPTAPAPPTPPASTRTLTGTVLEFTASGQQRPVPNLRLQVRSAVGDGAARGVDLPEVVTDANGRYEISGVSNGILFFSTPPGSSHKFPCDFYPVVTMFGGSGDLPVVPVPWSGDRLPPGMDLPGTSVLGIVSERVNGTLRPVAGATVTLDTGQQDPPATTNETGFYMICSVVGTDQYRTITATKDGHGSATRQIFGGWDFRIDLELERN
jgi:hypothetical protein